MADWISFWNGAHAIYVSDRHRQVHYARIATDLARHLPGPHARVLDYGCGDALAAPRLAEGCAHLTLSDAAPAVRERLAERFGGNPRIAVRAPEEVAGLPDGSFDLVIVNSVVQYLSPEVLADLLDHWRRLLSAEGRLLLADIIPPSVSAPVDALALLRLGWSEGFLLDAVAGLARTAVSPYSRLRAQIGLATYEERELLAVLDAAGFSGARIRPNVGHNQQRMAFLATPRGG